MRKLLLAAAVALSALHAPVQAKSLSPEEEAAICAEAEGRYKDIFGKAPSEEPVAIVTMYKYRFCPGSLTVKPGTTVRWVNVDKRTSHSFWFNAAGLPESDRLFPEDMGEMTFVVPGEYPYLCGPHWESHGMVGTVTVAP